MGQTLTCNPDLVLKKNAKIHYRDGPRLDSEFYGEGEEIFERDDEDEIDPNKKEKIESYISWDEMEEYEMIISQRRETKRRMWNNRKVLKVLIFIIFL